MIAFTLEIGSELKALLTPLVVAAAALISYRRQQREFKPNGGSTMRDAVDRIEKTVTEVRAEQVAIKERVTELESKAIPLRRTSDQLPPPPATNPTPEA